MSFRSPYRKVLLLLGLVACATPLPGARAADGIVPISGMFQGKDGAPAEDISGIACRAVVDGRRSCMVINDENKSAQLATLSSDGLAAGAIVPLIGPDEPTDAVGRPPASHHCTGGRKRFKDLDGEGVAISGPDFYVVGSHGCSRKDAEFRTSSFLLVKVTPDGADTAVERTFRLSEALVQDQRLAGAFTRPLSGDGLNIEGLAVVGKTLFAGLRAPAIDGRAVLVATNVDALFSATAAVSAKLVTFDLGPHAGIRDLSALDDGRLLVLAGPTHDEPDAAYAVYLVDPAKAAGDADGILPKAEVRRLLELPPVMAGAERAKAEGITLVDGGGGHGQAVLVLFDGMSDHFARTFGISIPAAQ